MKQTIMGRNQPTARAGSRRRRALFVAGAAALCSSFVLWMAGPALGEGTIAVENRSGAKIKVAGEGGSRIVDADGAVAEIAFTGGKAVGIDAKIWWVANPRELCQLFVPWGRTVIVSGTSAIRCRSEQ